MCCRTSSNPSRIQRQHSRGKRGEAAVLRARASRCNRCPQRQAKGLSEARSAVSSGPQNNLSVSAATSTATASVSATAPMTTACSMPISPLFARTRFVHRQGSPFPILSAEHGNGISRVRLGGHFDKPKTSGAPCRAILHDVCRCHAASLRKQVLQFVLRYVEGEITHEQLCAHVELSCAVSSREW